MFLVDTTGTALLGLFVEIMGCVNTIYRSKITMVPPFHPWTNSARPIRLCMLVPMLVTKNSPWMNGIKTNLILQFTVLNPQSIRINVF